MNKIFIKILYYIGGIRLIPHFFFFLISKNRNIIREDLNFWLEHKRMSGLSVQYSFILLLQKFPELRNIFYMRIGRIPGWICNIFLPKLSTLYIYTKSLNIGAGFYVGHGWTTVVNAQKIGNRCRIFQNVTIGKRNFSLPPIIGNNVTITAHAVVLGDIVIGDNSSIGAGAIVVKSIPPNCTVVPEKPVIIKRDGIKSNEKL